MKKNILFIMLLAFFGQAACAQTTPQFVTSVEGIKEYSLPNGLKILLISDAAESNVVVNIVYQVGSRHEGYGETGMAHLLEHMLFKRSSKFSEIKKAIADKGAFANGTTWYDRTNYYEILPASDDNLRWALEMEADRMVTSAILQSDLETEFSVVRNEFEIGENYPDGVLFERILSAAYVWHNYGKSTIGSKEDIERVPASRLKAFYQKYYQPNNATLIVGGKFDEQKALDWIGQYFGVIPKPNFEIEKTYTVEPPQDGERFVELKRNGDIQYVAMAYHTPCYADKDFAANNALISILTNNPSGALYKALVDTKLASNVYGYTQPLRDPGFSYFACEVLKDKDIYEAEKAFLETMDKVPQMSFTEDDLKNAQNKLIKDYENTFNKTVNLSIALTEYVGAGDWRLFFLYRDNVEKLTLQDIQSAAQKYYPKTNRTWGRFIPEKENIRTKVNEVVDINALVKDYKGKNVELNQAAFETSVNNILKNAEEGKLKSGGKFVLLEKPAKGNKIEGRILLRMGDEKSLSNKSMIAELTARMLKLGTKNRSKKDINNQLDQFKTNLYLFANVDGLYVSLNTDRENLSKTLEILQDMLRNPAFDKAEFEKLKLEVKSELEAYKSDPQFVASEILQQKTALYPKNHPYSYQSVEEKIAMLEKISLEDLKNFYANFYGGKSSYTAFVGAIDKTTVRNFLTNTFENWNPKMEYKRISTQYFDIKTEEQTIQINDKTNAAVMGKISLNIGEKDPDYPAIEIANEMLGGGAFLSSRIPERLRENEGMSYGAGSYVFGNSIDKTGEWGIYAFFNPIFKDKLDSALKEEIKKALDKGFSKDEFEKSLKSWLQQRQITLGFDNSLASILRNYLEQGRNIQEYQDYENKVKVLTVEKVNATLRKYFDMKKLVLIYAGDFAKK